MNPKEKQKMQKNKPQSYAAQPEKRNDSEKMCENRRSCSGCQTWNLTYEEELSMKMGRLIRTLGRFGHVEEILPMENPYHYRNKLQALFQYNGRNQFRYGIYQSATHHIVKSDNCLIENKEGTRIVKTVSQLLTKHRVPAWDPAHHKGLMRHVMVRYAAADDSYMVVLVTAVTPFAVGKTIAEEIVSRHPKVKSVINCKNSTETPLWMEEDGEVLYGTPTITDRLAGCLFRISARSFYQVNTVQTEKLYSTALEYAALKPTDKVIDAYCGIGTIGIAAAKNSGCTYVISFDNNENAIRDAEVNARINGLENITFTCADAGRFAAELVKSGRTECDVMFVDPPRAGCDRTMLSSIVRIAPDRLVYVSCSPDSLARDLDFLRKNGYQIQKIQPVDMFPRTTHVETVCLLSKLNAKQQSR